MNHEVKLHTERQMVFNDLKPVINPNYLPVYSVHCTCGWNKGPDTYRKSLEKLAHKHLIEEGWK